MGNLEWPLEKDANSLREKVFSIIEDDILNGRRADGEALKEAQLSDELGVSRTPVREAIRQLELEGLVRVVPNKGAVVQAIKACDVDDIYAIRMPLEGLCARWAAERISEEAVDDLRQVLDLAEFYEKKKAYDKLQVMDSQFHKLLYEASGSHPLKQMLSSLHHYIMRARSLSFSSPKRAKKALKEHRAILEAVAAHDAENAERLATEHIAQAKAYFNTEFRDKGGEVSGE